MRVRTGRFTKITGTQAFHHNDESTCIPDKMVAAAGDFIKSLV